MTFTPAATSGDAASYSYAVGGLPASVVAVRFTLYAAGGVTQPLDMQTAPVAVDVSALTHEQIFNLLTKNGAIQGIYQEGGQLYINGAYIKANTLSAISSDLGTITAGRIEDAIHASGFSGGVCLDLDASRLEIKEITAQKISGGTGYAYIGSTVNPISAVYAHNFVAGNGYTRIFASPGGEQPSVYDAEDGARNAYAPVASADGVGSEQEHNASDAENAAETPDGMRTGIEPASLFDQWPHYRLLKPPVSLGEISGSKSLTASYSAAGSTATAWRYTGVYTTLLPYSAYVVTAQARYGVSCPNGVAICTSQTFDRSQVVAMYNNLTTYASIAHPTVTYCGMTGGTGLTLYVFAQCDVASGTNSANIQGFCIPFGRSSESSLTYDYDDSQYSL